MAEYHSVFTPIPEKTSRRAKTSFGNGNIYLSIGDQIDDLFTGIFRQNGVVKDPSWIESVSLFFLITAVQYEEQLPDLRFIEAIPGRIEIKYALHLSSDYPDFDSIWLSGFRQQILSSPADLQSFQELLDRLKNLGLFCRAPDSSIDGMNVLKTVTIASLTERVVQAMYLLLEKLAIEDSSWLRSIILPHWYERYNRSKPIKLWPDFSNEWRAVPQAIGQDLRYLIDKIDKSPISINEGLPTLLVLKQAWEDLSQATGPN